MNIKDVRKVMRPVNRRLRMMASRGSVTLTDDTKAIQQLQLTVLNGEVIPNVQRVQQFGFSGNPPNGATAVVLCIAGSRSYPLVIALDDPASRATGLPQGASEMYDQAGNYLRFHNDGTWSLHSTGNGTCDSPQVTFNGNLVVGGNLNVGGAAAVSGNQTIGGNLAVTGGISSGGTPLTVP
jgi:phage baseplate assembly protein V